MAPNKQQERVEPDQTGALPGAATIAAAPAEAAATVVQPAIDSDGGGGHRIAISEHPRASRFVRKARELAGLGGFAIGGWMSLSTHGLAGALTRALIAGMACQLVVWAAAVLLCRHLIVAEIKSREDALMRAAAARLEAAGRRPTAPIDGRTRAAAANRGRS